MAVIERAVIAATERAEPSVVAIARVPKPAEGEVNVPALLRRFPAFGQSPTDPDFVPNEYAAGVVVDASGFIVTTYHALGNVEKSDYYVWSQHKPYQAKLVAATPWYDVAVLKVDAELTAIELGDARHLRKGSFVVALGNPFGTARDGSVSASWGLVSNLHRSAPQVGTRARSGDGRETLHHYGTLIQTDVRRDDGFSGGALIDLEGKMVGLTTSYSAGPTDAKSAGFAIPVDDTFRRVLGDLKVGRVPEFGFLGVETESLSLERRQAGDTGARVGVVIESTPGAYAGIKSGDTITRVNGRSVVDHYDLIREIGSLAAGSEARLEVLREPAEDGFAEPRELTVTLLKKLVRTLRPPIATAVPRSWRGMIVDYASVNPAFHEPIRRPLVQGVYVVAVEEDSAAWLAGMRVGDHVTHLGDAVTNAPATFHELVDNVRAELTLRAIDDAGAVAIRTISP